MKPRHRPHKWKGSDRQDRMRTNLRMEPNPTIESALSTATAPYALGGKNNVVYRDMMTGNTVIVGLVDNRDAYKDIQQLRHINRGLRKQVADLEAVNSGLEKALPLKKSVEGTGKKMIGYVVSGHPTNGNRRMRKSESDEDVTEPGLSP